MTCRRPTQVGPFASDGFRLGADPAPVVVELDQPVTLTVQPAVRPVAAVRHDRVEVVHHGQRFVYTIGQFQSFRRDAGHHDPPILLAALPLDQPTGFHTV